MAITDVGLQRIASALAAQFPDWAARERIVRAAAIADAQLTGDPNTSWGLIVVEASRTNRLGRLLDVAIAERDTAPLRRMAAAVAADRDPAAGIQGFGAVVVGAGALIAVIAATGAVLAWPTSEPGPTTLPVAAKPAEVVRDALAGAAPVAPLGDVMGGSPTALVPSPISTETPALPSVVPPVASPEKAVEKPGTPDLETDAKPAAVAKPAVVEAKSGKCGVPADGRLGWLYAGEIKPKIKNNTWTLDHSGNVRADYPRAENRWNAKARVKCTLSAGDVVTLGGELIVIPGGVWVPVGSVD